MKVRPSVKKNVPEMSGYSSFWCYSSDMLKSKTQTTSGLITELLINGRKKWFVFPVLIYLVRKRSNIHLQVSMELV